MSGWWMGNLAEHGDYALLVSWIFWVLFSITLHELAHGWAALWQGDDTPRRFGRMTPNPIVHMGWMSLLMFAIVGIAWGVMPTDPSKYRWKRRGRIVVAGAGPAMNIAIALVALTATAMWTQYGPPAEPLYRNMQMFLLTGGWLNLTLAAFNLLPVPPLDGSGILMGLSYRSYHFFQKPEIQMYGMFVLMAIFISGVGGLFFNLAMNISHEYVDFVLALLP
jgi:Zn-dependent protease